MLFHQHWAPRGHTFGTCMSHPDTDLMYVNIPKNASSWTKPNLKDLGWEFYNYHYDHLNKHAMVVLRDPIDRWLSGICEYFTLYHRNIDTTQFTPAFYELVMDQITFDDHTEKQVYFLEGLDPAKCTFFYCNEHYRTSFSQFLKNQNVNARDYSRYEYQHTTEDRNDGDQTRARFKELFKPLLSNEKFAARLKDHFSLDYKLIQSVSFYTTHDHRTR